MADRDGAVADRAEARTDARVAIVQHQARRALALAAGFVVAAGVAAVLPHDTGAWLPLHLLLVGGLLLAISGAAPLFAVTWAAGPPVSDRVSTTQHALIAVGAGVVALGRAEHAPAWLVGSGGAAVVAGLLVLTGSLVFISRGARQDRFRPAQRAYVAGLAMGVLGSSLGIALVSGLLHGAAVGRVRSAHATVNVFGLLGLVIVGTLPFFVATQARTKIAPSATARHQLVLLVTLGGAVVVTALGLLSDLHALAAAGFAAYAVGLAALATLLPRLRMKQWRWAGARLVMLHAGLTWWVGSVATAAALAARGLDPLPERLLLVLAIGTLLQILLGSLAYLGPVLRGGGHERLGAGFRTTRSWVALVGLNVAAAAAALGWHVVVAVALGAVAIDGIARAVTLFAGARREPV